MTPCAHAKHLPFALTDMLELASTEPPLSIDFDYNHEMKVGGAATLLLGLLGGTPVYSQTKFNVLSYAMTHSTTVVLPALVCSAFNGAPLPPRATPDLRLEWMRREWMMRLDGHGRIGRPRPDWTATAGLDGLIGRLDWTATAGLDGLIGRPDWTTGLDGPDGTGRMGRPRGDLDGRVGWPDPPQRGIHSTL